LNKAVRVEQIHDAMEIMKFGDCSKIVLTF